MSNKSSQRKRIIAACDFGTTFTGVAWADSSAKGIDDVHIISAWPGLVGEKHGIWKTPSKIAYASENDRLAIDSWGFDLPKGVKAYSWVKLLLDDSSKIAEFDDPDLKRLGLYQGTGLLSLPDGKTAVEVVSDYLSLVYKYFMSELERRVSKDIVDVTPIEWHFTCPAVWPDKAKQATKQAAQKAGFASRAMDTFSLIPEPEAGAIAAFQSLAKDGLNSTSKLDGVVLVCDCGGGTVDITTYTITKTKPKLEFKELLVGAGGKCGSTFIDREFMRWMIAKFGDKFTAVDFAKRGPGSKFLQEFEGHKTAFGRSNDPSRIYEVALMMRGVDASDNYDADDSNVKFSVEDMKLFFDPVIARILALLSNQLDEIRIDAPSKAINTILLIGGFGDSPYLCHKITDWAKQNGGIRVLCPPNPQAAIVKGAVVRGLCGVQPKTRMCRFHYGYDCGRVFREGVDPPELAYINKWDGSKYCDKRASWLLRKGQEITEDTFATTRIVRTLGDDDNKKSERSLYVTSDRNAPEYAPYDRVRRLGTLPIDLTGVDLERFEKKRKEGRWLYHVDYYIEVFPSGKEGVLTFRVRCAGEVLGQTEINYADQGPCGESLGRLK